MTLTQIPVARKAVGELKGKNKHQSLSSIPQHMTSMNPKRLSLVSYSVTIMLRVDADGSTQKSQRQYLGQCILFLPLDFSLKVTFKLRASTENPPKIQQHGNVLFIFIFVSLVILLSISKVWSTDVH